VEEWDAVEANRVAEEAGVAEDTVEEVEVEEAVAVRNLPVSRNSTVQHWLQYQS